MLDEITVNTIKPGIMGKISKIWIVPAVAVLVSLFLTFQQYLNCDTEIVIDFPDATGIEVGKTELKFQNVTIGVVSDVQFSDDFGSVLVSVEVKKEMAPFIDADAKFWVVKPEISVSGVRGLETLLKGAYIHGEWDAVLGAPTKIHLAEEKPPIVLTGEKGREISLSSEEIKSVSVGAPVYHRGVKVGLIKSVELSQDGNSVLISAFVHEPYDKFINTGSRFWNASGIDVELNTSGFNVNIASVASLIQGGVAFSTSFSGGEQVTDSTVFDLYPRRLEAEDSLLTDNHRATVHVVSLFDGSVKGLRVGSNVEYHGLKVGTVKSISAIENITGSGANALRLSVKYSIEPTRLGLAKFTGTDQTLEFLNNAIVDKGLRSRLVSKSILGGLTVELFEAEDAEPASLDLNSNTFPVLPSVPTSPETLKIAAESMLRRVSNLPIEEVVDRVRRVLEGIDDVVSSEDTQKIPSAIVNVLADANALVANEDLNAIPTDIRATIESLVLQLEELREREGVKNLADTLEKLNATSDDLRVAVAKLPGLADGAEKLIIKIQQLKLEELVSEITTLATDIDAIVTDENTKRLPTKVSALVQHLDVIVQSEELRSIPSEVQVALVALNKQINEFDAGNGAANLVAALERVKSITQNLDITSEKFPGIADDVKVLITKVQELPAEKVLELADRLLNSADDFLNSPESQKLPEVLSGALNEVKLMLEQLRQGGTAESVNSALASASQAMASIETAADRLPGFVERLETLSDAVKSAAKGISPGSSLYRKVQSVVDNIDATVRSFNSLVRLIERKPNSLLTGR